VGSPLSSLQPRKRVNRSERRTELCTKSFPSVPVYYATYRSLLSYIIIFLLDTRTMIKLLSLLVSLLVLVSLTTAGFPDPLPNFNRFCKGCEKTCTVTLFPSSAHSARTPRSYIRQNTDESVKTKGFTSGVMVDAGLDHIIRLMLYVVGIL
jgi:hypothetical protein